MHSGRNLEEALHRRTQDRGQHHTHHTDAGVAEKSGIDELREFFAIASRRVLGNVANDGGADAEVEQAVVTGHGEDQHPDSESRITQVMQDERRKENADQYVDGERGPARTHVLQDLSFFKLQHEFLMAANFWFGRPWLFTRSITLSPRGLLLL